MSRPVLVGERVHVRPATEADVAALVGLLAEPAVREWWGPHDETQVHAAFVGAGWVVEHGGRVVGGVEVHEETDPEYRHAALDLFLATDLHGRGLGRDVVRTVVRWLVTDRGHHRVTIDPARDNARAIRCYEAVGFRTVGVLRDYWFDHDRGEWRDGLLMDLLARELPAG